MSRDFGSPVGETGAGESDEDIKIFGENAFAASLADKR